MEGATLSFKNFFTRGDGQTPQQQQMVIQEVSEERGYYKRGKDPDWEIIFQLDETIIQCDRHIDRFSKQLLPLDTEIRALKAQHDKLSNKEGPLAKDIAKKATQLMFQQQTLNKRINGYNQQRLTLSKQVEDHREIKEAERMSKLLQESTIRMQGSIANLDMATIKGTASGARKASDYVNDVSSLIFNPFDISPDEQNSTFLDAFNAIELNAEDEPVYAVAQPEQRVVNQPVPMNKTNALLLEDDLF